MGLFQGASFNLLERSLDASTLRQKVIANNIANTDTPHFKRSEVRFEQLLQNEINSNKIQGYRTHSNHFQIGRNHVNQIEAQVLTEANTAMNSNQNNVDIDAEMSLMAENQLTYNLLIQQLNHQLKLTRTSIGR